MGKWFLLPGMGATSAMYDALRSEIEFEVNFLDWPEYRGEVTYRDVAKRVVGEYGISGGDIVGGSSLGGMVALEIAKILQPRAIVLLGSAVNRREAHGALSILSPLAAAAPVSLIQILVGKHPSLAAKMFSQSDPEFIRKMCLYLPSWPGYSGSNEFLFRLHGRKDRIIQCPATGAAVVENAGHLLTITHPRKVGLFLNSVNGHCHARAARHSSQKSEVDSAMINENETPLAIDWLYNREQYDRNARSVDVLDAFFSEVGKARLKLADLGCGTGSHSLFLSEKLHSRPAEFHMVERETYLLDEARRRIKEKKAGACEERQNVIYLISGKCRHAFYFYNELVSEFMRRNLDLQAACASALFDLFTEDEFNDLVRTLKSRNMSLYGGMNYCGTDFFPSCARDVKFVNLYEEHMSRLLGKGRPLGKRVMTYIQGVLNPENGWHLTVSNSDWILGVDDSEFISQNLDFYENAIPALIFNQEDKAEFNEWMAEKKSMIAGRKLQMRVYHQDFFARCL